MESHFLLFGCYFWNICHMMFVFQWGFLIMILLVWADAVCCLWYLAINKLYNCTSNSVVVTGSPCWGIACQTTTQLLLQMSLDRGFLKGLAQHMQKKALYIPYHPYTIHGTEINLPYFFPTFSWVSWFCIANVGKYMPVPWMEKGYELKKGIAEISHP